MKAAPVSGDMLVKLALGALAVGLAWYTIRKAKNAVSDAVSQLGDWTGNKLQYLNPMNDQNIVYSGVNSVGGYLAGDTSGSWTLGGAIYDAFHDDPFAPPKPPTLPLVDPRKPPVYDYTPGIY